MAKLLQLARPQFLIASVVLFIMGASWAIILGSPFSLVRILLGYLIILPAKLHSIVHRSLARCSLDGHGHARDRRRPRNARHPPAIPKVQVIALTSFKEVELFKKALKPGAIGYLLKNSPPMNSHARRAALSPEAAQPWSSHPTSQLRQVSA